MDHKKSTHKYTENLNSKRLKIFKKTDVFENSEPFYPKKISKVSIMFETSKKHNFQNNFMSENRFLEIQASLNFKQV